jgi:hypothetical protein
MKNARGVVHQRSNQVPLVLRIVVDHPATINEMEHGSKARYAANVKKRGGIIPITCEHYRQQEVLKMDEERQIFIVSQILNERSAQDEKWGEQNHNPVEWMSILMEEVGEASKEAIENHFNPDTKILDKYRNEMIQVAAVALAMIECLDRDNWR